MSRLIETIRIEDGVYNNLSYHEKRMRRSLSELYNKGHETDLSKILGKRAAPASGLHKCRIVYDDKSMEIEFSPYIIKPISSLKLVQDDHISYPHKFIDRKALEENYALRGDCDDVLIVKNGFVTDTSYANLVLRKGREWFTPSTCLLEGTMRRSLLDSGMVREIEIKTGALERFETFKIINAMLMFDAPEVSIENIVR